MKVSNKPQGSRHDMGRYFYSCRSGVSLLIALILVSILLSFGLTVNLLVLESIRDSANMVHSTEADYMAEWAMEEGLLENSKHGPGYTSDVVDVSFVAGDSGLKATYKIQGQVPENSEYDDGSFGVPQPGSGDVAKDCDPLKAVTKGQFYWPKGSSKVYAEPQDHPCNWNKIIIGETVTIPLYYTNADGKAVNLFKHNTGFELKIRTACEDGEEFCAPLERYDLDDTKGDPVYNGNDPIVSWQIVGEDGAGGEALVLEPYVVVSSAGVINPISTIIYEKKIGLVNNDSKAFKVLDEHSFGEDPDKCRGEIKYFLIDGGGELLGCADPVKWDSQKIVKPVFKFKVIHSLQAKFTKDKIPYLEYQLIVDDATSQPTDVVQTITAEGFSGSFKKVLEAKVPRESGLLEYVIQQ